MGSRQEKYKTLAEPNACHHVSSANIPVKASGPLFSFSATLEVALEILSGEVEQCQSSRFFSPTEDRTALATNSSYPYTKRVPFHPCPPSNPGQSDMAIRVPLGSLSFRCRCQICIPSP